MTFACSFNEMILIKIDDGSYVFGLIQEQKKITARILPHNES